MNIRWRPLEESAARRRKSRPAVAGKEKSRSTTSDLAAKQMFTNPPTPKPGRRTGSRAPHAPIGPFQSEEGDVDAAADVPVGLAPLGG